MEWQHLYFHCSCESSFRSTFLLTRIKCPFYLLENGKAIITSCLKTAFFVSFTHCCSLQVLHRSDCDRHLRRMLFKALSFPPKSEIIAKGMKFLCKWKDEKEESRVKKKVAILSFHLYFAKKKDRVHWLSWSCRV